MVQPYGLGDMLFITPVLRALRLVSSVERVDLLIGSRTKEIIASNPHVNDIYVIDKDKMPRWQPEHVNQVTAANVANYFENCQPELTLINSHD